MSIVSIVRIQNNDVESSVRKAVALTNGFEYIAWEGATVLVKPPFTILPFCSFAIHVINKVLDGEHLVYVKL